MAKPAQKEKPEKLTIEELEGAFTREALLVVYGDLKRLRQEYGDRYKTMKPKEFEDLRKQTARRQAEMFALRDPQIDDALTAYKKKNKKDADAIRHNIELALDHPLVQEAIGDVNERVGWKAKALTRLQFEWRPIRSSVALVLAPLGLACESSKTTIHERSPGEEPRMLTAEVDTRPRTAVPQKEKPKEKPKEEKPPAPTYAEVVVGPIGSQLGEPNPLSYFQEGRASSPPVRDVIVGAETGLPSLQEQVVEGPEGTVIIQPSLHIQARALYNPEQDELGFSEFQSAVAVTLSGEIQLGMEFSLLGKTARIQSVGRESLTLEIEGTAYSIEKGGDLSALGWGNVEINVIRAPGSMTLVLYDRENRFTGRMENPETGTIHVLRTVDVSVSGLDLAEDEYTEVRVERASPETAGGFQVHTHVAAGREAFDIRGIRFAEFYIGATETGGQQILYRPPYRSEYEAAPGNSLLYIGITEDYQAPVNLLAEGEPPTHSIVFRENSGPPGEDRITLGFRGESVRYEASSRPVSEGGTLRSETPSPRSIEDYYITHRGSYIDASEGAGVYYWMADRIGQVTLRFREE